MTTTPGGATGATALTPARAAGSTEPSLGELVGSVSADLTRLVRDEMRLAQAEVAAKAKTAGVGVGAFGAAGVLALYAVGVFLAAAVLGLSTVLPAWLAAVIVGVVVLVVAGIAALVGKKKVQEAAPPVPTKAVASVKTDVAELKETIPAMTEHVQPPPGADATTDEIEADIAATRARLAGNVDALAGKMDVKAQANDKVADLKAQAQAKVAEAKVTAQVKVGEAQAKVADVTATASEQVSGRLAGLPRPAQIALAAAPVLVVVLLIVRKARA